MMPRIFTNFLTGESEFRIRLIGKKRLFDKIVGYEGIKRTFLRSLNSEEPVHILLVGPPGQAKW